MVPDLLHPDGRGLWCSAGGFHIDPWKPVPLALITHAHSDHARSGSARYVSSAACVPFLKLRLAEGSIIDGVAWSERVQIGSVRVSFHPASHIRGSAQIRIESGNEVWVVSGDYKRATDPTCEAFEVVPCDTFITEATFGLPIYRWNRPEQTAAEISEWWSECRERQRTAVLFTYSLGKAQRVLGELEALAARDESAAWMRDRPVLLHGATLPLTEAYAADGVAMLPFEGATVGAGNATEGTGRQRRVPRGGLVIAPPSAAGSPWMRRFGAGDDYETAFASGWMRVRGVRRRRGYDRGFVLSDHVDWPDLLRTVAETKARRVLVTHGNSETVATYLRDIGIDAAPLQTPFALEEEE